MEVSDQLHAPRRVTTVEGVPNNHSTGGWVGSEVCQDVSNTGKSAERSVCSPCTILLILYRLLTSPYVTLSIPLKLSFTSKCFPSQHIHSAQPPKPPPTPIQTKRFIYQNLYVLIFLLLDRRWEYWQANTHHTHYDLQCNIQSTRSYPYSWNFNTHKSTCIKITT